MRDYFLNQLHEKCITLKSAVSGVEFTMRRFDESPDRLGPQPRAAVQSDLDTIKAAADALERRCVEQIESAAEEQRIEERRMDPADYLETLLAGHTFLYKDQDEETISFHRSRDKTTLTYYIASDVLRMTQNGTTVSILDVTRLPPERLSSRVKQATLFFKERATIKPEHADADREEQVVDERELPPKDKEVK